MTFINPYRFAAADNDPYFDDVLLLIGANGTDGSTSFIDESSYARTLTAVSDAQIDTAQSKFDGSSALFDGTDDYISVPYDTNFHLQASTPFTIEMWARFAGGSINRFMGMWASGAINAMWCFYLSGGDLKFRLYNGTTLYEVGGAFAPTAGQWYHIAVDRDSSNVMRVYADGAVMGSATISVASNDQFGKILRVGGIENFSGAMDGHLDEVRFTQNVARYGGAFTPPTEHFPRS